MKYILSTILCFLFQQICAQNLNYIRYNTNNSKLPHDILYNIEQDKNGFIWVSTDDGLVRFDGMQMVNFENGLRSKYVISTNEEKNKLWICTWRGGIFRMENDSILPVKSTLPFATLSTNNILVFNDIVILWLFKDYRAYKVDPVKGLIPIEIKLKPEKIFVTTPQEKEYYHFIKTASHRLLAYNSAGIYEVLNGKLVLQTDKVRPDEIWESPEHRLYYCMGTGIYLSDERFQSSTLIYNINNHDFPYKKITSFKVLPSGNICLGFEKKHSHNTYFLVNTRTNEIFNLSKEVKSEAVISCLITDKEGSIWMGTDGDGLYHIFDCKYHLIGNESKIFNPHITDLHLHSDKRLFIGTKRGVFIYKDKNLEFYKGSPNPYEYIGNFFITEKGEVAAVPKSFSVFVSNTVSEKKSRILSYYSKQVFKTYVFIIQKYYVSQLFNKLTGEEYVRSKRMFIPISTNTLAEDDQGVLWLGSNDGLYFFHPETQITKHATIRPYRVTKLKFQENKGMWVGTNNGLFLVKKDKSIEHWGLEEGLSNLSVTSIHIQSENSVWIGTQNGLFNLRNRQLYAYKKRNGLIANDVTCLAPFSEDELAVGSSKGITFFYMNELKPFLSAPELLMEHIQVDGKFYDGKTAVSVPFNSTLSFTYNAITFVYPELILFEYRIKEDDPWIRTQNKSLVFTNLEPGNYKFQLRVKKHDSGFGEVLIIPLKIEYPWWRSWYFYMGVCLSGLGLVYFFVSRHLSKQKETIRARQQLSELKLKALQAQLNPHFISNSLNAIQYFTLKQDEITANQYLTRFADLTRLVLETSRKRFVPLKTELDIVELYMSLEKLRFENKFEYTIETGPGIDIEQILLPGMLIQPFVENSINHGIMYLEKGITGLLHIQLSKHNNNLKIVIDDNGIGRDRARELKKNIKKAYRSVSSEIVQELRSAVNELPGNHIEIETIDKTDDRHTPLGTTVIIFIKINHN